MNKKILFLVPLLMLSSCGVTPEEGTYYNVTIETSENGTVTCNKSSVKEGDFVTFKFAPQEGYVLEELEINKTKYTVNSDHYSYFNVQSDLVVKAEFVSAPILVRYFDHNDNVIFSKNILAGEDASFFGKEPLKSPVGEITYIFSGWSLTKGGTKISSFVFNKSTDLYPVYDEVNYKFNMNETLTLKTLTSAKLNIESTYPSSYLLEGLMSTDVEVASVDKEGNVTANGSGKCNINFVVGGIVVDTCEVTVINDDNVYQELCYASGEVIYNHNRSVGKYKACQTLSKDSSGTLIDREYIEFSGDFKFAAELSSSDNFGLQVNKELHDNGAVKKALQFGCTTGSYSNIYLKENGTIIASYSLKITIDVVYNFRITTTPSATSGKVDVNCYIDNNLVISTTVNDLDSVTNYCGLRYANPSTSVNYITFSNLVVR